MLFECAVSCLGIFQESFVLVTLFTVLMLHGIKSDDDEAHVENADEDDSEQKPEIETVPYVTPDIDPTVFFAEHFDSDNTFEAKWIKSSAKKE